MNLTIRGRCPHRPRGITPLSTPLTSADGGRPFCLLRRHFPTLWGITSFRGDESRAGACPRR
ncbi:MAG: hypothetical protein ACI4KI_07275 [Candidatus Fimenecus sp.]